MPAGKLGPRGDVGGGGERWGTTEMLGRRHLLYFCRTELEVREKKEVPRGLLGFWLGQMVGGGGAVCGDGEPWGRICTGGKACEFSLGYKEFVISNGDVEL